MNMSLPAQTRLVFDLRAPMRDGVTLSADVMFPAGAPENGKRYPAIVLRTPYIKANPLTYANARYFAERGYVYVMMDVRGRGDSDGEWKPYVHDGRDGYDAIEWVAAQAWSNGKVGTLGGSYLGRIQWLAALEQPPHLGAMVVLVTPSDPFVETPTGLPSPMHLCWEHYVSGRVLQPMEAVQWSEVYEHLPLLTMDERVGRTMANWREQIAHARMDEYWDRICYQNRFEQVNAPVLHISGWFDDEQVGTPMNFIGMTTRGAAEARDKQRLLMGPWGHAVNTTQKLGEVDFGPQSLIDLKGEQARWFDRWLKDDEDAGGAAAVTIFVMGENMWRDEAEWPLARTQFTPFYLHSGGMANSRFGDGALTSDTPREDEPPDGYRYDPARPVPFISEPTSSQIGGPDDYAAIERRDDVLVYRTEPLTEDVEVTGPVRVELYASSAARDTDFMAKLVDVHPDGFVQRLCDGMVRARFRAGMERPELIEPGHIYNYEIDCWNTAQVFKAGHRIGLEIASSAFPKYDRNLNTGADLGVTSEMAVAEQRIYHDAAHPSAVILPIIPR